VAKLIINPTSSSRREIPLSRTLLSIGRDPSNDVVLPDALVSRRHAVVECRGTQYVIRDCNSSNGSLVNGDRVTEQPLKDGDLLSIGTARMLFREVEVEESAGKVVLHPSSPRFQCPSCQSDYRRGDLFCRKCGHGLPPPAPVSVTCVACASSVPLPANFCNACGAGLPEEGREVTKPRPRSDAPEPPSPAIAVPPPAPVPVPRAELAAMASGSAPQVAAPAAARQVEALPLRAPRPVAAPAAAPRRPLERGAGISTANVNTAGFGPRLAAGLLDAAIVGIAQAVLVSPAVWYFYRWFREAPAAPVEPGFLPILLSVALVVVALVLGAGYYVYFWGVRGATPGKQALGLVVRGEGGELPIGVGRAGLRLLGYVLSSAALGIGFLMILFGGHGLHDRLAATRVVRFRTTR
jgi:uncharacterized RDD family membrane protein YckC